MIRTVYNEPCPGQQWL